MKKTIKDVDFNGKRALVRVDFNVPIKNGKVTDDTRIREALPTIKYIIDNGGKAILMSHLGRIKTEEDKIKNTLSVVAVRLEELIGKPVKFVKDLIGEEVEKAVSEMQNGDIILLENTRFYKGEEKNDPELAEKIAKLGDIHVNDAFGTAHRAHASNVGVAKFLPSVAGFLMEKEIEYIGKAITDPEKPFVFIIGGAKVSDKIEVLNNIIPKADTILIGGAMMFTFLKAQGYNVGNSLCEDEMLETAKNLMNKAKELNKELCLPIDTIVAPNIETPEKASVKKIDQIIEGEMGLDIGPETIKLYAEKIKPAKTVVWNGPMGVFEVDAFAKGTFGVAEAIAANEGCVSVVGGGDSVAAINKLGISEKFTHISTGGGASLEMLGGKEMPGIASLQDK